MPDLFGRAYSRSELLRRVGRLDQVAGVRLLTLVDGGARGVRVLEFRTGSGFVFDVLVDRAFDIGRCELRGMPLAWTSAVGRRGALVLRARGTRLLPWLWRRAADDLWHRPRAVHGRRHRCAVPLPTQADGDVRPSRAGVEPSRPAGGIRRALGRGHVHALGRGRDAAGDRLRRAAHAPPPHRGRHR